jgi:hypothetical protein
MEAYSMDINAWVSTCVPVYISQVPGVRYIYFWPNDLISQGTAEPNLGTLQTLDC